MIAQRPPDPFALAADILDPQPDPYALARAEQWRRDARPEQLEPPGEWQTWYLPGGRGSGKTRTGAETFAGWLLSNPPGEWAVIAPTYGSARSVCIEGKDSGLLSVLGPAVETWNRSLGELRLTNRSVVHIDGADDGALRIQGYNLCGAWCDEVGLWRDWDRAWNESLLPACRMPPSKIVATGTPKGNIGIPKMLVEDPAVPVTRLLTKDNINNLSAAAVERLYERYAGTLRGRQELEGELLEDVEGALWTLATIEKHRVTAAPALTRIVVAIDPAASVSEESDHTGIIAAGIDNADPPHGYILEDRSAKASPDGWARCAIEVHERLRGDRIVAERNNGGDMVTATLRTVDPNVPVRTVWASRGKKTRAEPVAALYEQGRVHHVGAFPELESEMTSWTPEDRDSPDRMDAMVWALSDLMLGRGPIPDIGPSSLTGVSSWRG